MNRTNVAQSTLLRLRTARSTCLVTGFLMLGTIAAGCAPDPSAMPDGPSESAQAPVASPAPVHVSPALAMPATTPGSPDASPPTAVAPDKALHPGTSDPDVLEQLAAQDLQDARVPLIVELAVPIRLEAELDAEGVARQRERIAQARERVLARLGLADKAEQARHHVKQYVLFPGFAVQATAGHIKALKADPEVARLLEDVAHPPTLDQSVTLVGANAQGTFEGYSGAGQVVAILDTGVAKNHVSLSGKVVSEACYATVYAAHSATSFCPGGATSSTAVGSGLDCSGAAGCGHGTHVADIAAGKKGVAKDANIISMKVFSKVGSSGMCGGAGTPCALTYSSDLMKGLERVYELRTAHSIASVNLSLGGGSYSANCDGDGRKVAVDNLRAAGIATIAAAGNDGNTVGIGSPACISSIISVGSTNKNDTVSSFSNSAGIMTLWAPGGMIYAASNSADGYVYRSGTSMAAPHVAGAWAVLRTAAPQASVQDILDTIRNTGLTITDTRNNVTKKRPRVAQAVVSYANFDISSTRWEAPATSATTQVQLTASNAAAGWRAQSSAAWLTTTPVEGVGSAQLTLSVTANTSTQSRQATLNVGRKTIEVVQAGAQAVFTATPATWSVPLTGGTKVVALGVTPADASWTATIPDGWVSLSRAAGTGPASITFTVATNAASARTRESTVQLGGAAVRVVQPGAAATFQISETELFAPAAASTFTVAVTASHADALWQVSSSEAWVRPGSTDGEGTGNVTLSVQANNLSSQVREAIVTIAGKSLKIRQAGSAPQFTISQNLWEVPGVGGTLAINVGATPSDTPWVASSQVPWLTVTPASGAGNQTVSIVAQANPSAETGRVGLILAGDKSLTVRQAPATPVFTLDSARWDVDATGGTRQVRLNVAPADATWTVSGATDWLHAIPAQGRGPATLTVGVAPLSTGAAARSATLQVGGESFAVHQEHRNGGFALVRAGTYQQGSPSTEAGRKTNEVLRSVVIARDFWIQTTPVTQTQWSALMGNAPSHFTGCPNCPVERVNHFESLAFANALSQAEGMPACYSLSRCTGKPGEGTNYTCSVVSFVGQRCTGYRLPTEAEWEIAARAGDSNPLYGTLADIAWYADNSGGTTKPVGQKQSNSWGIDDTLGNVQEWVWDRFATYTTARVTDPAGPSSGTSRAVRGCHWGSAAPACRMAARQGLAHTTRSNQIGFRLARSLPLQVATATASSITGPGVALADGVNKAEITVRLFNADRLPVPDITPTFDATGDGNTNLGCSATDLQGIAICALKSTVPGPKAIKLLTPLVKTGNTITFRAKPSATHSRLRAQARAMADGVTAAAIVVELRDADEAPVVGFTPVLGATAGASQPICPPTDTRGVAVCGVTHSAPATSSISMTWPITLINAAQIQFVAPPLMLAPEFVRIAAGTFRQGSPLTEAGRNRRSEVQRDVTLTRSFFAQTTPVTQGQWQALMNNNPSGAASCGPDCPVERVNYWEALAYANALSLSEGKQACYTLSRCTGVPGTAAFTCASTSFAGLTCEGYRLPTEAEWEYAARAGAEGPTYEELSAIAWWKGNATGTRRAALKIPNAHGLFDTLGNVGEWTMTPFAALTAVSVTDPLGLVTTGATVKSCGFNATTPACRFAARRSVTARTRAADLGLRLVRTDTSAGTTALALTAQPQVPGGDLATVTAEPQGHTVTARAQVATPQGIASTESTKDLEGPWAIADAFAIPPANAQGPRTHVLDVLANDTDARDGALFLGRVEAPQHLGEVNTRGQELAFTPFEGMQGTEIVRYEVCNVLGHCAMAEAALHVGESVAPVARDDRFAFDAQDVRGGQGSMVFDVLANDALTGFAPRDATLRPSPSRHGELVVQADNTLRFVPAADFAGQARIPYTVCAPEGPCHTAFAELTREGDVSAEQVRDDLGCASSGPSHTAPAWMLGLVGAALIGRRLRRRP